MMRQIAERRIRDVMRSSVLTVRPDTPLRDLKALFAFHDTSAFAVVDDRGRLRGVVTTFDLLRGFRPSGFRWFSDLRSLWSERVEDIMSRRPGTLQPDEPVAAAGDMMLNRNITAIPVVEGRDANARVIGMIDLRDVLRSLTFESPVSHDRHADDEWHARSDEPAEGRYASSNRDDHAHSRESHAGRAS